MLALLGFADDADFLVLTCQLQLSVSSPRRVKHIGFKTNGTHVEDFEEVAEAAAVEAGPASA